MEHPIKMDVLGVPPIYGKPHIFIVFRCKVQIFSG